MTYEQGNESVPTPKKEIAQEGVKETSKQEEKEAVRKPSEMEVVRAGVARLEKSEIAGELKELMDGWLLSAITDPIAREAYIDKIKEGAKDIKIGDLLERMADVYLSTHPEINAQFQANKTEQLPKVFEGMFDVLFSWALEVNSGPGREKNKLRIEELLVKFKAIISEK